MPQLVDFKARPPLTHLKRLTTKDGLIQHADHEVPDPSFGYSIDDNARALIACLWHYQVHQDPAVLQLAEIYFHYLERVEKEGGSFHNFLSFTDKVLDPEGSEDSVARAIWALGETIARHPDDAVKQKAKEMFEQTNLARHLGHHHIRAQAYILLGLAAADRLEEVRQWADLLKAAYHANSSDDWKWFEDSLRYANAALPCAMAVAARKTGDKEYERIAKESFDWLDQQSRVDGIPAPIGQNGWYYRGKEKALYDQQPLEAADMVLAAVYLYKLTKEQRYLDAALEWMNWYYGTNCQNVSLLNESTRGVYDALTPGGVNENQGAESIVTYLLAYLALDKLSTTNG